MTLQELQTKANAKLADFWVVLQNKQDAYFAKHGRYFQLVISPEMRVVDGADSDFAVRVPHYEQNVADYEFVYSSKIPFQIEVHQWVRPNGEAGYTGFVWVQLPDERIFTRSRTSEGGDSGWRQFTDE